MSDRDFEINGRKFKLNKMDPFKQFHIVRRLAPILGDIIPAAQKASKLKQDETNPDQQLDQIAELAAPLLNGFSKLSDTDANFVLYGLLASVEVYQDKFDTWGKVAVDSMLMIQDLELPIMLQIAGRAFGYNLKGFFALLPQASQGVK